MNGLYFLDHIVLIEIFGNLSWEYKEYVQCSHHLSAMLLRVDVILNFDF